MAIIAFLDTSSRLVLDALGLDIVPSGVLKPDFLEVRRELCSLPSPLCRMQEAVACYTR